MQLYEATSNIWDLAYDNNYDGVPPSRVSFNLVFPSQIGSAQFISKSKYGNNII